MIRWCSYCQSFIQEVAPYGDFSMTHGICDTCLNMKAHKNAEKVAISRRMAGFYSEIFSAASEGRALSAEAMLNESVRLGIAPLDFVIGMVQPALYKIGDWYTAGEITVAKEHAFSTFAVNLIELVRSRYKLDDAQRSRSRLDVLLVCADGNYHTIGLRIMDIALRQAGFSCLSLIPSLPTAEIVGLAEEMAPWVIGVSVALPSQVQSAEAMIAAVQALPAERRPLVVAGGNQIKTNPEVARYLSEKLLCISSPDELFAIVRAEKKKTAA